MQKKGQVTIFIIVGIIILGSVALMLFLQKSVIPENDTDIMFATQVQTFVEKCIDNTGKDAVYYVSEQGGYADLPEVYDSDFSLPFYFHEGNTIAPTQETIEGQLSVYMQEMLPFCLDFTSLEEEGYNIESEEIMVKTKISRMKVSFLVNYPLYVSKGNIGRELVSFAGEIPTTMKTMIETSNQILSGIEEHPDRVNLGQLYDLSMENGLIIETVPYQNYVYFTLTDKKTIDREIYDFNFAVEYLSGVEQGLQRPEISSIPNIELNVGELFNYHVEAQGEEITFSVTTDLFDISNEGRIEFRAEEVGQHDVVVKVEDKNGAIDVEWFKINII
jgi:hypothetical protein